MSRNITLHINDYITVYAIIFHRNGTVRGFSFSKQGFAPLRKRYLIVFFGRVLTAAILFSLLKKNRQKRKEQNGL